VIGIAQVANASASMGLPWFLQFLALVSLSLAILNLLPIPVLDGGHLLYYLVELIKGSPVSEQAMIVGQYIGLAAAVHPDGAGVLQRHPPHVAVVMAMTSDFGHRRHACCASAAQRDVAFTRCTPAECGLFFESRASPVSCVDRGGRAGRSIEITQRNRR
jgi:hypothetical protein